MPLTAETAASNRGHRGGPRGRYDRGRGGERGGRGRGRFQEEYIQLKSNFEEGIQLPLRAGQCR